MNIKFVDDNLVGQNGLSRYIDPKINWSRDISDYEICIYTDQKCFNNDIDHTKKNYAWIIEPPIINGENYSNIVKHHKNFIKVFSYNLSLIDKIDNFTFVPHGGTWLMDSDIGLWEKTKLISMIFSDKQWNSFHRLRHNIYQNIKDKSYNIDFFGSGCNKRIEFKIEALKDYMFSIVVENSIENDYFTEKLIDCLLSGTIPIYHGTPNIGRYFDINGIIILDSLEQLEDILQNLTIDDYTNRLESVINNYHAAHRYIHPEHFINEYIQ